MRFRIQTDGDKFRVQKKDWWWWLTMSKAVPDRGKWRIDPILFDTRADAQAWIDEQQKQDTKRKWRTI